MQLKSYGAHLFVYTWLDINFFHREDIQSTEIYLYLIAVKIVHRSQVVGNIRNNSPKCSFIKGLEGYHTVSEMISLMLDAILPWRSLLELSLFSLSSAFCLLRRLRSSRCIFSVSNQLCEDYVQNVLHRNFFDLLNSKRNLIIFLKIFISTTAVYSRFFPTSIYDVSVRSNMSLNFNSNELQF